MGADSGKFSEGTSLFAAIKIKIWKALLSSALHPLCRREKHRDWLKVKYRRIQYCVVGGYPKGSTVNALLLALTVIRIWSTLAKPFSLRQADWSLLTKELPQMAISFHLCE